MLYLNDVVAFLLEAGALILLARWAWITPKELWLKIALTVIAVTVFVVIWGLFFAPMAKYPLSGFWRYLLEYMILLFPYLQFIQKDNRVAVGAAILILVNLLVQAFLGRAEWW